ncbi:MAG TPA: phosphatase PAP2 family protein [Lysobacter sp.]
MKSSAASTASWLAPHWSPGPGKAPGAGFYLTHAWIPLIAFAALALWTMVLGGDQWLADRIYAWQGGHWQLRHGFVTEQLIHRVGRDVSTMAWLTVLAAWIVARIRPGWGALRRPLTCLLVSIAVSTALVAWVKSWSNMDCPWDLVRYGGAREYVGLFAMRPLGLSRGACFPAGHASGGYAWLALYFLLWSVRPAWRWMGLAVGGVVGLLFGFSQQIRGAHFLSHDLWTLAICWGTALGVFLWFRRRPAESHAASVPAAASAGAAR